MKNRFHQVAACICVLFLLVMVPGELPAADVTLAWDQSAEAQGYLLHYGTQSEQYTETIDVENTTQYTITGLTEGYIYYFAATAYNTHGESEYSQQIQYDTNDVDGDGVINYWDICPTDPGNDADGDGICAADDNCPQNSNPQQSDEDGDGAGNACDGCPDDPEKTAAGICGCGVADTDSDGDGIYDCDDGCPEDPEKTAAGVCGCGVADTDSDGDGIYDCDDGCPDDPEKTAAGVCGCGVADTDSDGDGIYDCDDGCPYDPEKTTAGVCGCGVADIDSDGDGTYDCEDNTPPEKPAGVSPGDNAYGLSLRPELQADTFYDQDSGDSHTQTTWQISRVSDFSTVVYEKTGPELLTALTVPRLILLPAKHYYWRVRYYDRYYEPSEWSDTYSFYTGMSVTDQNGNRIPDSQEAGGDADADYNGIPDAEQDNIKTFLTCEEGCTAGIKAVDNVVSVDSARSVCTDSIEIVENMPQSILCGLMGFAVTVSGYGDNATVSVYMSEEFDDSADLYAYDSTAGWYQYPSHILQEENGYTLRIIVADGGPADADGSVNGKIVHLFGIQYESAPPDDPQDSGSDGTDDSPPSSGGGGGGSGGSTGSGGDTTVPECSSSVDCAGDLVCNQQEGLCVPCLTDSDCSDGLFCNGPESCIDNTCVPGVSPCDTGETCHDDNDMCIPISPAPGECSTDSDCDDGIFCNGQETCSTGICEAGMPPCSDDQQCSEEMSQCRDVITIPRSSILTNPFRPLFNDRRCQWLLIVYDGSIDITAESTIIAIEGGDDDFYGIEIDPDRKPRQFGNMIFIPICIDKYATTGTWSVLISTAADVSGRYGGRIIEGCFRMK